jgi:hypothetical protein
MSENTDKAKEHFNGGGDWGYYRALYFQNKEIIEQNEKIINILTEIKNKGVL